MGKRGPGRSVRRNKTLRVVVSEDETRRIAERAEAAKQSVSSFLRQLGLGQEPKSRLDRQLIMALIRINGDQGRLGGLLKLWLSERPGQGAAAFDVRKLLRQIEATQERLQTAIRRL